MSDAISGLHQNDDVLIVGGGSAGATMAARSSEDPHRQRLGLDFPPGPLATICSIACLDSRDSCGSVGSAKVLEVHAAGGKQTVNAALEVT
jgi:hypothetical protein